jgi:sterol desaturase/sphingolipid hydroxylase (fatty acid hydroxylase superfamily)
VSLNFQPGDFATLKSAAALGGLTLLMVWESLAPCQRFFTGRRRARTLHAARNFTLGLINAACTAAASVTLWKASADWAARNGFGLVNWLALQGAWRWLVTLLCFDAWMYWWHRANHRVPWLWRLHRVHHSDPHMDVTTAQRFHLGEIVLSSLLRVPVLALIGMTLTELAVYETLMFAVVQLHHANVALPAALERLARSVIVTPALHKVHHSRLRAETDSNYGSLLAWWDLVFRSRRERRDLDAISFGLDGFDNAEQQRLRGLVAMPLDSQR